MVTISYHHSVNDLQGLAWEGCGPFGRPGWFALLEGRGQTACYALARSGETALCLPLVDRERTMAALTNWYAFTYAPLHTGAAADPVLAVAIARDLARRAAPVELAPLAAEDGTLALLQTAFRRAGWLTFAAPCDANHVLPVEGRAFAQYLASRPGPLRTTLKRKAAKVEVRLSTRFDAGDWAAYEAIYAASWKPQEGDPALLRAFAERESAAGHYRFALALAGDEPVAAQFWTVEDGTAYIHKLAHRQGAEALSPGTTLTAALLEQVIDRDRVGLVDFGTGDDRYKRDWMEAQRPRFRLVAYRPARPAHWPAIGRAAARALVSRRGGG